MERREFLKCLGAVAMIPVLAKIPEAASSPIVVPDEIPCPASVTEVGVFGPKGKLIARQTFPRVNVCAGDTFRIDWNTKMSDV